jgi:two-component system sensor histidine kinase UhpB
MPHRAPAPLTRSDDFNSLGTTTLKLRLSLLITALIATVTLAGGAYIIHKAREDIREEVLSTVALTAHFLDGQLDSLNEQWSVNGYTTPLFRLRELGGIRHLSVAFYDAKGRLLESNGNMESREHIAPSWFASLIALASEPLLAESRPVSFNGRILGRLFISADPSYETDEMWTTCRGLLSLLLAFFVVVNLMVWWAASRALQPVDRILQALEEFRHGNLSARLPGLGLPELSRISIGFNHMADALEHSANENQRLTRQLLKTQEMEKTSLARDLHDEIGQCVSAIHADAAAIRNRGGESVRESAEAIVEVTEQLKQIVRGMLQRLRPPIIAGLGVMPALRDLVGAFQQRNPDVACCMDCEDELLSLDAEVSVAIYRVIQECLTNITVHARASIVDINITLSGAALSLTVSDDGIGFVPAPGNRGYGLTGIRERIKVLGGTCDIQTQPGHGTRIAALVPLPVELEGTP